MWYNRTHIDCAQDAKKYSEPIEFPPNIEEQDPKVNVLHLLHMLRHLETLEIRAGPRYDRGIHTYLSNFLNGRDFSTRLRSFTWWDVDVDIRTLIPALLIPSVKEVHSSQASRKDHMDYVWGPDLPQNLQSVSRDGQSNVERLTLSLVQVDGLNLSELLRLPRALKVLTYHGGIRYQLADQPPLRVFKRALSHVASELEFLDLFWNSTLPFDDDSTLSFQKFVSLKFLVVNCSLIHDPRSPTNGSLLSESLPPSLEVLYMYGPYPKIWHRNDILECWKLVLTEKSTTYLPNLWFIGHWNDLDLLIPFLDLASSQNVQIALEFQELIRVKEAFLSKIK
ncbi:2871_t:CDS:1 [Acaulospora colombiana]|uniref:2871_t:CDS:1 n=1 Tax=Acaulospora colombiana TaxID=27376 RepID=A0ACA9Q4J7_9GLOM|nr:2871_t:CDS:1 [Acaulospora colombiana]